MIFLNKVACTFVNICKYIAPQAFCKHVLYGTSHLYSYTVIEKL